MFGELSCEEKKKMLAMLASVFFCLQESSPNQKFLSWDGEKWSASAQGQATQKEKSQGAATSVEDAIIISIGLNLSALYSYIHNVYIYMDMCISYIDLYV